MYDKEAIYAWRKSHPDKYTSYMKQYTKIYYNSDEYRLKNRTRLNKLNCYKREVKRLSSILL
jgi:hypothetical protein